MGMTTHRVEGGARLGPGETMRLDLDGTAVCLARTEAGELCAIDDSCSHEEESLSEGWVEDDCIECPAHNSRFDLRTGAAVSLPATEPVASYPVVVDGDDVVVELPAG